MRADGTDRLAEASGHLLGSHREEVDETDEVGFEEMHGGAVVGPVDLPLYAGVLPPVLGATRWQVGRVVASELPDVLLPRGAVPLVKLDAASGRAGVSLPVVRHQARGRRDRTLAVGSGGVE